MKFKLGTSFLHPKFGILKFIREYEEKIFAEASNGTILTFNKVALIKLIEASNG